MTSRARPAPLVAGLSTAGSAVLVFAVFASFALVFSDDGVLARSPEAVAVGALATATILPRVRRLLMRWERVGSPANPYATVADVASRLARTPPSDESLARIAEAVRQGVAADRVEVVLADDSSSESGYGAVSPQHRSVIGTSSAPLGEMHVFKASGLSAHEVRLLDDVAASAAVAVSSVLTARQLERRSAEVAAMVEAITVSLRRTVVVEQRHRRLLAEQVQRELAPIFDEVRAHIRTGSLTDAAAAAETLIDALRSVSTSIVAGAPS